MTDSVTVRVGSVWADNGTRAEGDQRMLRVESVDNGHACCVTIDPGTLEVRSWSRRTRISLSRMRPTSTGYRLVTDADRDRT